jgi:hypothetical protein
MMQIHGHGERIPIGEILRLHIIGIMINIKPLTNRVDTLHTLGHWWNTGLGEGSYHTEIVYGKVLFFLIRGS